jgi:hypothetical protein
MIAFEDGSMSGTFDSTDSTRPRYGFIGGYRAASGRTRSCRATPSR